MEKKTTIELEDPKEPKASLETNIEVTPGNALVLVTLVSLLLSSQAWQNTSTPPPLSKLHKSRLTREPSDGSNEAGKNQKGKATQKKKQSKKRRLPRRVSHLDKPELQHDETWLAGSGKRRFARWHVHHSFYHRDSRYGRSLGTMAAMHCSVWRARCQEAMLAAKYTSEPSG